MSEIKPSTAKKRQDEAKRKLIERLRAQQPIDIGPWTRDELYDTNEGFRDLLLIGRQNRPSLYDIRKTRPQPLVARADCHTVRGRLDPTGHEVTPLDEEGLRRIAEQLRSDRVEAVAICLLHAY